MYGSNFCSATFRPRATSSRPIEAAAMPLPSEETTPPVTKMKRVRGRDSGISAITSCPASLATARTAACFTPLCSSSRAWRRAAASPSSAPSMRTSSPTTSPRSRRVTVVRGGVGGRVLDDREVAVGERGDLRQVGDADDLAAAGELAQLLADRARGLAADAGVDLVEDQRRPGPAWAATPMSASITRDSSPPEAVSRSGPAGTPGLGAIRNSTSSPPRRAVAVALGDARLEARALHRQPASRSTHRLRQRAGGRAARFPQPLGQLRELGPRGLDLRLAGLERLLGARQLVAPAAALLGVGEHGRDRAAVLALQAVEQREALLDLVEPAGRRLDALAVAAQLAREVVGLDGQRLRAVGQRVELGVDAADRLERRRRGGEGRRGAGGRVLVARRRRRRRPAAAPISASRCRSRSRSAAQRLLLGLARLRAVDLLELPLEQVELAVARAGPRAQLLELLAQRPLARVGGGERLAPRRLLGAAEAVEDLELGGGEREPAVLVLAVEGEQRAADLRRSAAVALRPPT